MKETIPACPRCGTNKFVVRDRRMEKMSTLLGGTIGAGISYFGISSSTTIQTIINGLGNGCKTVGGSMVGLSLAALQGALLGFMTGSTAGNKLGETIDSKIRMRYRCTKCNHNL